MLRLKLYKKVPTPLGMAEVTLLDVPLDPKKWTKRDDRALDRLDERIRSRPSRARGSAP